MSGPQPMYGRTRPRSTRLFLALFAAMLVVALVSRQSWAAGPRDLARSALAPVEAGMTALAGDAGRLFSVMGDISSLRAENDRLRADDLALRREVVELNAAAQENASLREALALERSSGHSMLAAQVIGRGPDGFSRTLEIDRGTADGVRAGMVVVTAAGLLGRLSEAGPHASIVQTIVEASSRVDVYLSRSNLEGSVTAVSGTLQLHIDAPIGGTASRGEWALTSGIGGAYPRGLVVGEVANLSGSPSGSTETAELAWINDPSSVSLVLVITDFAPR